MSAQSQFRAALLDFARDVPRGLQDGTGQPAAARYDVYRNTIASSLNAALAQNFPILAKLLGTQHFEALTHIYHRQYPPRSPLMMDYGDQMPAFLEGFEPLKHIGYLADMARLEIALRTSYHAADATPITPNTLAVDDAALSQITLGLAPSTILLRSDWPLFDIWRFNSLPDAPAPQTIAQSVVITRRDYDPEPHALTPAQFACAMAIQSGAPLGTAHAEALNIDPAFDLTPILTLLLTQNALTPSAPKGPSP